jgi:hypothetical protein
LPLSVGRAVPAVSDAGGGHGPPYDVFGYRGAIRNRISIIEHAGRCLAPHSDHPIRRDSSPLASCPGHSRSPGHQICYRGRQA